jgi:hypothetical protein
MNFLQLCQDARKECGIAVNTSLLPTTTVGQTGQLGNIVRWVAAAWLEIQGNQHFDFLWEEATVTILAATNATATGLTESRYMKDSAHIGDVFLTYIPWQDFRSLYPSTLTGSAGQNPSVWSIRPDGAMVVDLKPAANTEITVERYKQPVALSADADIPALPTDLHMLIVWGTVLKYASEGEAITRLQAVKRDYGRLHQILLDRCLPSIQMGGPLC